mgnify:CR=1 FL=1
MAKVQHYYIFFTDDQFEAHEFRLQELLRFCQRRGWKKPFVFRVETIPGGKRIFVDGPNVLAGGEPKQAENETTGE